MRLPFARRPASASLILTVSGLLLIVSASATRSDEKPSPKPAEKDSSKFLRPKPDQADVVASISPSTARAGDTVKYSVTAKLGDHWHIYKYSNEKQDPETGPRPTKFDFFDTGGLKTKGEWKASKPVIAKAEPAFDNQVLEFYEDEVTWTIELDVPEGTAPGKKNLQAQIRYQICDPQQCKSPVRVTLPPVELMVEAPGGAAAAKPAPSSPGAAVAAKPAAPNAKEAPSASTTRSEVKRNAPAPTERDSSKFRLPKLNEAQIVPSLSSATAKAGETVRYSATAKLGKNWHIYKYSKEEVEPGNGPQATTFDFFDTGGLKLKEDWKASKPAIAKAEPAWDNKIIEFYEDEVTWSIELTVPEGTEPGKKRLQAQIQFQICDPHQCKPPVHVTLAPVELTVVAGAGGASGTSAAKPAASDSVSSGATKPPANEASSASDNASSAVARENAPAIAKSNAAGNQETSTSATRNAAGTGSASSTPPATGSGSGDPVSDAAAKANQGIIPFLIFSAFGGLLALVMPCVWPMVPITVNFFVKQGQAKQGRSTTGLAITYCLAIIGIFTSFGVLCSFFFSASALQRLAANPWLNTVVALLFLAFGLSLLGLFEFRLPSFLLNASAKGESRGGLIGVVFMALTLTITSFTCTFPVVGGLVVMAAGGKFFYPIIGLATFATVLALPFFLLALAPGLLSKMPKSGDWMNAVKVVGGLIELGAAFKFINTAEIGFGSGIEDTWFNAAVVLTIWIILSAVCGLYLLGMFRTDHDHDEVKIGPGRLLIGSGFLVLALFLAPALFGRPLQSQLWNQVVGLLPPDVDNLTHAVAVPGPAIPGGRGEEAVTDATSSDPDEAERQQKSFHGVVWGWSLDAARERAKAEKRPILIDFTGVFCPNCRQMEQAVMPRPEIVKLLKQFVPVQLYTDIVPLKPLKQAQKLELAEKNAKLLVDLTNDNANPSYVVLAPDGGVLARLNRAAPWEEFARFLNDGLSNYQSKDSVAQNSR